MTTVIKAENLGKKYIIRHKQDPYDKFADVLVKPFKYAGQKLAQPFTKEFVSFISAKEEFWALKDVSFEIKQGDRVGIIGRNGAGKSTLLKLISRITEPTTGKISIKGRVSSLLEVGTGFHPELTGRENIYLNGAILGMSRKEIKRKFDEIVAFAEVDKFLDTPVKRYSSGMYVRLAFAVAAHLEPEILIVDEVLAVGDTAFQKKCLGKMQDVGQEGRTVLFVSHNTDAVKKLCSQGILIVCGEKFFDGDVSKALDLYTEQMYNTMKDKIELSQYGITINGITLNDGKVILPFEPLVINIEIISSRLFENLAFDLTISNDDYNGFIFYTSTILHKNVKVKIKPGKNNFRCVIPKNSLCSDYYFLGFRIAEPVKGILFFEKRFLRFEVANSYYRDTNLQTLPQNGRIYMNHYWEV